MIGRVFLWQQIKQLDVNVGFNFQEIGVAVDSYSAKKMTVDDVFNIVLQFVLVTY